MFTFIATGCCGGSQCKLIQKNYVSLGKIDLSMTFTVDGQASASASASA